MHVASNEMPGTRPAPRLRRVRVLIGLEVHSGFSVTLVRYQFKGALIFGAVSKER